MGTMCWSRGSSSSSSSASFYACTFLDLLSDPDHGVTKYTGYGSDSSFTFYDNAPPLPPGMVLPPPSLTYSYRIGSWSSCSSSCGEGMQTRSVTCYRSDGQSVSDSYCSESKPLAFIAYQSCNTQGCAKKKGNAAAGIAVGVIFAVIVLCVAPWAWSYYRRKVAKDDRDDTVYDMVPVQVAKAQENCLEDFFSFGRKKPSAGSRKFHTMDYAVPPGSNTLAPILVTVPDGMPGAGQELQWKKPPAFSSGTVVSNITYYYDDDIPPTSSTPEEARTTSPQEVETMPGGVATFVCTNQVLARASADVNDKLPHLEVNKLAEGVQILASEEGDGKWLRCASEGRFKGFYFPFYHPTSGGAIFKKLDGNLSPASPAEDLGKQAVSIEMMSLTHVPPPPPHQPEVAIPIPGSVGGDEETAAAVAEDGKDIALALLASVRLDKYASAFEELGIRDVRDFFEVTDDDLTALGMSELEKRRFKSQVQSK
ncbi:KH_dom_type_1 domain-containing protein [Pycnococcus provasolii]